MISTETTTPPTVEWDQSLLRNPHQVADKRRRVQKMFAAIAPSYDLNNRLHSLWMDQSWRRRAVKLAGVRPSDVVVDVACGTGDLTLKLAERLRRLGGGSDVPTRAPLCVAANPRVRDPGFASSIIGIDFTFQMLPIARRKALTRPADKPPVPITWVNGDAQCLPLPDACCDVVSIAFGIRNVADPAAAIREFFRVLRPGGRLVILEFSLPTNRALRAFYNLYFRQVLPRTATLISGDKTGAYKYLPESVNTFIGREQMAGMMQTAGFLAVSQHPMTFGVCVAYRGVVPVPGR
jgi:demethylmenaquinone methyltransferase/2-methoxy-6-polyprenyl-1,4-benzoquinol methylase